MLLTNDLKVNQLCVFLIEHINKKRIWKHVTLYLERTLRCPFLAWLKCWLHIWRQLFQPTSVHLLMYILCTHTHTHTPTLTHTYTHLHTHIYIYIYISLVSLLPITFLFIRSIIAIKRYCILLHSKKNELG